MNSISVRLNSTRYSILVGPGLISSAGDLARDLVPGSKAAVITDSNVHGLYTGTLTESLLAAGFHTSVFVCPARNESRSTGVFLEIINFLHKNGFSRDDAVFALGGGMICDIAGFAASAYKCGTRYIMVPTTITAQTVSTVGTDACIDTDNAGRIIGAPYAPDLAICDTATLTTLPETERKNGFAEVIRYAAAAGEKLFGKLEKKKIINASVISDCIRARKNLFTDRDSSAASRLRADFGNIPGMSLKLTDDISSGDALASGMSAIACACYNSGLCSYETMARLTDLLIQYGLKTDLRCSDDALNELIDINTDENEFMVRIPVIRKTGLTEIREFSPDDAFYFIRSDLAANTREEFT